MTAKRDKEYPKNKSIDGKLFEATLPLLLNCLFSIYKELFDISLVKEIRSY